MPTLQHTDSSAFCDGRHVPVAGLPHEFQPRRLQLNCGICEYALECVEQSRRFGTWLGSFICPNCRSEYFYAYRWGRLVRKA